MATLLGFQNAFISPEADYSEIQVTGPEYQDAVSPVTSYAQLSFTANWTDTQGRVWPREGRMDALVRQDGGILFIMVEAKGGLAHREPSSLGPHLGQLPGELHQLTVAGVPGPAGVDPTIACQAIGVTLECHVRWLARWLRTRTH